MQFVYIAVPCSKIRALGAFSKKVTLFNDNIILLSEYGLPMTLIMNINISVLPVKHIAICMIIS